MKITIYELLGMVKDEPDRSIYVKYFDRLNKKEDVMWACKENIIYKLEQLVIELNDTVEIIEEEKKIPEKLDHLIGYDIQQFDDLKEYVEITTNDLFGEVNKVIDTLNQLIDYLKSKGE